MKPQLKIVSRTQSNKVIQFYFITYDLFTSLGKQGRSIHTTPSIGQFSRWRWVKIHKLIKLGKIQSMDVLSVGDSVK